MSHSLSTTKGHWETCRSLVTFGRTACHLLAAFSAVFSTPFLRGPARARCSEQPQPGLSLQSHCSNQHPAMNQRLLLDDKVQLSLRENSKHFTDRPELALTALRQFSSSSALTPGLRSPAVLQPVLISRESISNQPWSAVVFIGDKIPKA